MRPVLDRNSRIMKLTSDELIFSKILLGIELCKIEGLDRPLDERQKIIGYIWYIRLDIINQKEREHSYTNNRTQAAQYRPTHNNRAFIIHCQLIDINLGIVRSSGRTYFIDLVPILILALIDSLLYSHFITTSRHIIPT